MTLSKVMCYTGEDAVDRFNLLPPDGLTKAPTTVLCSFANQ